MSVLTALAFVLVVLVGLLGMGVVAGVFWLLWKVLRACFWIVARAFGFVRRELVDALHTVGALVTALATLPLMAVNLTILRLGAARHYGRAFVDEMKGVGAGVWRVALGNPLRLLGLGALVERVEHRLPDVVERAPRTRKARRANFEGYDVVGTLPSGGSGAQLFVARPKNRTHERFLKAGRSLPSEVVIKSFALEAGSTLPQIVRESRALEAASQLGLVCEHQLTNDHFFYVMPYVKGEDLERVTRALHARGTPEGLADAELRLALGYGIDLLDSLQRFHSGGLWHKDVKPSNIIVARGRAHLVDFGLVTPLASAMTLTTHGTEYYRDPEMVRLAMQGVKVHEVDGARFDVYSAGAVLYALLENSFPAHGSLSRLSRRAPEALRWVVQRAMAELSSRYASAAEMRADLAALAAAADPFALRPADLPSYQQGEEPAAPAPFFAAPRRASFEAPPAYSTAQMGMPMGMPASVIPPTRSRRRRVLPALAGAAGLGGLFLLGGSFLVFARHADERGGESFGAATRTVALRSEPRAWSSLSERERRVLELAEGVSADLGVSAGLGEESLASVPAQAEGAAEREAPSAAREAHSASHAPLPAETALPPRGRVLVLDDLTSPVDARVLSVLRARLATRGFTVVGEALADPAGVESASEPSEPVEAQGPVPTSEEVVELLASARHALGLGRAEEPETQASLQSFLDQSQALEALILVSSSEEAEEHFYRVFVKGPMLAGSSSAVR